MSASLSSQSPSASVNPSPSASSSPSSWYRTASSPQSSVLELFVTVTESIGKSKMYPTKTPSAVSSPADAGVSVVGVRSNSFSLTRYPVQSGSEKLSFVVDEDDAVRKQIDIKADMFGFLGGRETYVVDASGKIVAVHNNQFDPNSHVSTALDALSELPKSPFDELAAQVAANTLEVYGEF